MIIKLKYDTQKKIENLIDSQNSEFKGIKTNKEKYNNILDNFKRTFSEKDGFQKV